ncbi:MAG: hydantoinase/oxoprolinase family protein [Pseudomonadota bacterium]
MRVGIEVGGTFTDLIAVGPEGVQVVKVPSTPDAPDRGAMAALDEAGVDLAHVTDLVHGSTVATNAVLERKGARVGVFVTRGTRDLFALQRHDRRAIYDLHYRKPEPVVRRRDICEIDERIGPDGGVVTALAPDTQARIAAFLGAGSFDAGSYDAVAICLLHSYANPDHEAQLAAWVQALAPDLPVTCSHNVSREFREYERASTTALAAYVQPVIKGYLGRLSDALSGRGFTGRFSLMQSNGGRMPAEAMAGNPITALFSGPAAGVIGAMGLAARSGHRDLITLDMGGTSTDVALIADGAPTLAAQTEIDGLPVRTPVIDIATVGAGGGSIAWVDDGGLLRVGPQSAGAMPGPACYGRGGTEPTVTDAHLLRGTLQADVLLAGRMEIDRHAATAALKPLADRLDLSIADLADSVIRIAESNIVRAIQQVSTERGHDPRDFALVPFGGAGPLHAARVAEELAITTVVVPPNAGVLSAAGLLMSDDVHYRARTDRTRLSPDTLPAIRACLADLRDEVQSYMKAVGIQGPLSFEHILEMRYVGQAFEVSVTVSENTDSDNLDSDETHALNVAELEAAFADAHHKVFEFSKPPGDPVEIVSFRVGARAQTGGLPSQPPAPNPPASARQITITEGGDQRQCRLIRRIDIGTDVDTTSAPTHGPILIEDQTATIYVPPGWQVHADTAGALILEREA